MKKFVYRMMAPGDYEMLKSWWDAWKFPVPPEECLPKRGVIVSDKTGDLYAGYLYLTDGAIGWMEWIVSNKEAGPARKRGALEFLVNTLSEMARQQGMKLLFTSTVLPAFRNGLLKCGFLSGDENIYQLIKGL